MVTLIKPVVVEPTDAELRESVRRSLGRIGVSYEELARQAAAGDFQSARAQLTWVAVAGLGRFA